VSGTDLGQAFDLSGRVAIVTGGNGGIGLGMARGMAAAGASIVVAARNRDKSRRAVAELEGLGATAVAIEVDVADERAVDALVRGAVERLGRVDVLVNNAGMNIRKPVQDLSLDEWRLVIDTNLTGAFLASRAVYPVMKKQGRGKIINIGSMMSIFGAPFAPAYARAGSTPSSRPTRAARCRGSTNPSWRGRRKAAGASETTWPASPCSSPARRPTS
jgi:2-dehydro-3-deoxy-D-gluconate 5-dehydrogenase